MYWHMIIVNLILSIDGNNICDHNIVDLFDILNKDSCKITELSLNVNNIGDIDHIIY